MVNHARWDVAMRLAGAMAAGYLAERAWGHPGHGAGWPPIVQGAAHPLTGVDHLLATVFVAMLAARLERGERLGTAAVFLAAMVGGLGLTGAGVRVPGAEAMLAVAVLGLGVVVAWSRTLPLAMSWPVVVAAGVLHGQAHAPGAATLGTAHALGLVAGTAALHGLAIAVAVLAVGRAGAVTPLRLAAGALALLFGVAVVAGL